MIIYIDTPLNEILKEKLVLAAEGDECIFKSDLPGEDEQRNAIMKVDIIFGNPRPAQWIENATSLKWMQLYSTGFDYYRNLRTAATVTNMRGYYAEPCAESMVSGILALYRGMDEWALLKERQQWVGHAMRTRLKLLQGKKVIILGAGNIGKRIAKILAAFDCDLSFYGRKGSVATIHTPSELEKALPLADIVIACLPGSEETKGFFTGSMIAAMHASAIFCNVGRGNLLADETVLVDALVRGKIGGAVLDVTVEEPIPPGHPLWKCPNTILSQHSGGGNIHEYEGILSLFLENLRNFKSGKPLMNRVELSKGY